MAAPVEGINRVADTARMMGILAAVTLATRVLGILTGLTMAVGLAALWIWARRKPNAQQAQPGRISSAVVRYIGLLPASPTRLERLVWVRRLSFRVTGPWIPIQILLALYFDQTWFYVMFGALSAVWLESLVELSVNIRRERPKNGADAG